MLQRQLNLFKWYPKVRQAQEFETCLNEEYIKKQRGAHLDLEEKTSVSVLPLPLRHRNKVPKLLMQPKWMLDENPKAAINKAIQKTEAGF